MGAAIHGIVEKVKAFLITPVSVSDFILGAGESVAPGVVIDDPNISLYCIDDENQQAIFVETPPEIRLSEAVFYYMTQYEQARRVITMDYETLHQVMGDLDVDSRNLIFIHNIARCGSTVISQAFNQIDGVVSLAEPDVYSQLMMMRHADPSRDDHYRQLLKSVTVALRKRALKLAIKFRIGSVFFCDLLHQSFPAAKHLFLYRQTETWVKSVNTTIIPLTDAVDPATAMAFFNSITPLLPAFVARNNRPPTFWELQAISWVSALDRYMTLRNQGIPILAVRYEDVRAQSKRVLAALFEYCGLPLESIDAAYSVFSKDSQEGTILSQLNRQKHESNPLTGEDFAQIRDVIRGHPVIQTPDFIAPGTATFA